MMPPNNTAVVVKFMGVRCARDTRLDRLSHLVSHLYCVENRALSAADSLTPLAHEVLLSAFTFYGNVCTPATRRPQTPSRATGSNSSPSTGTKSQKIKGGGEQRSIKRKYSSRWEGGQVPANWELMLVHATCPKADLILFVVNRAFVSYRLNRATPTAVVCSCSNRLCNSAVRICVRRLI